MIGARSAHERDVRHADGGSAYRAHAAVKRAVKRGALVNPKTCSGCSTVARVSAHHDVYARPLDVVWLCPPCHAARHRELRANAGPRHDQIVPDVAAAGQVRS